MFIATTFWNPSSKSCSAGTRLQQSIWSAQWQSQIVFHGMRLTHARWTNDPSASSFTDWRCFIMEWRNFWWFEGDVLLLELANLYSYPFCRVSIVFQWVGHTWNAFFIWFKFFFFLVKDNLNWIKEGFPHGIGSIELWIRFSRLWIFFSICIWPKCIQELYTKPKCIQEKKFDVYKAKMYTREEVRF